MEVDGYGNVYTVAILYGPYDVDPGPATYLLDNASATNGYLLKLDAQDGATGFAARLMNSDTGYLTPHGISVTSNGTIVTHGAFRATAAMDPWTDSFEPTVAVVQTEELYVCTFGQDIGLLTQEVSESSTPSLYPVPCVDRLVVDGHERTMSYRILDMTGRLLLSGNLTSAPTVLDVSSLPSGAYHIQLTEARGTRAARFLKH